MECFQHEFLYHYVSPHDGAEYSPLRLAVAVHILTGLLRIGFRTLVACGAGMSRSPVIAAAALSQFKGIPFRQTLNQGIQDQPHDVSPAFYHEVEQLLPSLSPSEPL